MRIVGLLSVATTLLTLAAACTTTNVTDAQCIQAGGMCFESTDMVGCGSTLPEPCYMGYTCCVGIDASRINVVDGAVMDVVTTGADSGKGKHDSGRDSAARDGARDGKPPDAARDASGLDSGHDATLTDSGAHADSGRDVGPGDTGQHASDSGHDSSPADGSHSARDGAGG